MSSRSVRRVHRLVVLYPRSWRERFGDEFEQLLLDELDDRPRSRRRTADVAAHAALAHLTVAGLAGRGLAPDDQVSRGLRVLGVMLALFLVVAIAIWSGLDVGWTWAAPSAPETRVAVVVTSAALLGMVGVVALAAVLMGSAVVRQGSAVPRLPLLVVVACGMAFAIGCVHFAGQWPGGRHPGWGGHSLMPPALVRLAWAGTQWVTAYWLHPHVLTTLPGDRFVWSVVSPLLLIAMTAAALGSTRSLDVAAATARAIAVTSAAAGVLGALFLAGAASWILSARTGPRDVFQADPSTRSRWSSSRSRWSSAPTSRAESRPRTGK